MTENKKALSTTLAPHIHATDSTAKRYWGQAIALIPVVVTACFFWKTELLRVLLLSLTGATAFEFLGAKLFGKKDKLCHGEAILIAILIALLMPPGCSSETILLANFLAVFVAKEFLGGMGESVFHPVFFACVFLQEGFPGLMAEPMILHGNPWILAAIGIGGLILMKQKQGYWETPVLYITFCFFCTILFDRWGGDPKNFFSGTLMTAFFLLADPVAMPLTRRGTRLFVIGAAFFSALLSPRGFSIAAAAASVLLMNLLTPWLDVWLKPVPYRAGRLLRGDCSR